VPKRLRLSATEKRRVELRLVEDGDHTSLVVEDGILHARSQVWITTSSLKDVRVAAPIGTRARAQGRYVSLFDELVALHRRGVEVRLLHAGAASRPLQARLRSTAESTVVLRRCPRVHQKVVVVDGSFLYLGSANVTGAGLGAKADQRRNFELGLVTDDDVLLDRVQASFDAIWTGKRCGDCRLRRLCPEPLDGRRLARASRR